MRALVLLLASGAILSAASVSAQEVDWQTIDATLGRKPAVSGDVHRYGFTRTDAAN